MKKKSKVSDIREDLELAREAEVCKLCDIHPCTLQVWIDHHGFPKPIYVTPGSPKRFRLAEIRRWLDKRAAKRHKKIHRGAFARRVKSRSQEKGAVK